MYFYLFAALSLVSSSSCPNYQCTSLENGMCISYNTSLVKIDPCNSDEYCPIITSPGTSYCEPSKKIITYN